MPRKMSARFRTACHKPLAQKPGTDSAIEEIRKFAGLTAKTDELTLDAIKALLDKRYADAHAVIGKLQEIELWETSRIRGIQAGVVKKIRSTLGRIAERRAEIAERIGQPRTSAFAAEDLARSRPGKK